MSTNTTPHMSLPIFLKRLASLEEEVQVLSAEKSSRMVEVETLHKVVESLSGQVRYTQQKMSAEMEEMKLFVVERKEEMLEESAEGRLEKERNFAVIESARSEQSMLREAVRNLKIEKIRLLKKMEVFPDRKQMAGTVREELVGLGDCVDRFVLARKTDVKLRQELEQVISVTMEYQEKLDRAANQIEKAVKKKLELERVLATSVKMETAGEDDSQVNGALKDHENTAEVVETKTDKKRIIFVQEKIQSVEKEIFEKSSALEDILRTVGSLVSADREALKREEEKMRRVEQLKEMIVLEKRRIEGGRLVKIAKFEEEKEKLERKEFGLNIKLANLNMEIERVRSRREKNEEFGEGSCGEQSWEIEEGLGMEDGDKYDAPTEKLSHDAREVPDDVIDETSSRPT
eukprot:GFUD01018117.1.p1 GENE.GFUD01018117.1~~GFUD01018117.1.p1  ORF type:complete len:403 (+),score=155.88 GFUD01018117.1:51-1259(+)